jgi:hypothetical protein
MGYVAVDVEGSPLPGCSNRMSEDQAQSFATKHEGYVLRLSADAELHTTISDDAVSVTRRWFEGDVALVPVN